MTTAPFLDKNGSTVNIELPLTPGRTAAATSRPIALSTEDKAALDAVVTAVQLLDDVVVALGTALGTTKNSLVAGSVSTAAPAYTTGTVNALSLDTAGALRVNVTAGGAGGGIVTNAGAFAVQNTAATPAGSALIGKVDVQFAGTAPDLGSGTGGSKTQRVIIDSSQFATAGQRPVAEATTIIGPSDANLYVTPEGVEYETVAASQTDQILGATGAVGDYLVKVIIIPGTAAGGAVSIKDGNGSAINIYAGGGTTPLPALVPFEVNLGIKCVNATTPGWKVTTGANITAIGIGNFT